MRGVIIFNFSCHTKNNLSSYFIGFVLFESLKSCSKMVLSFLTAQVCLKRISPNFIIKKLIKFLNISATGYNLVLTSRLQLGILTVLNDWSCVNYWQIFLSTSNCSTDSTWSSCGRHLRISKLQQNCSTLTISHTSC